MPDNTANPQTAIVWFRQDLRVADNPALSYACRHFEHVIPLYIWDPETEGGWPPGAASRCWLHHSLKALDHSLRQLDSRLVIYAGDSHAILEELIRKYGVDGVFWNRRYEPAVQTRDAHIKAFLKNQLNLECRSFNAWLWREPSELKTGQGNPYRVFTPLWKRMLQDWRQPAVYPIPEKIPQKQSLPQGKPVDQLALLPAINWDQSFYLYWQPGEQGAWSQLKRFREGPLDDYLDDRDIPSVEGISRLSPHLHFGEISVGQIIHTLCPDGNPPVDRQKTGYLRQLAWREFSWYLLCHFPQLPEQPLYSKFAGFPWRTKSSYRSDLIAWQKGMTGIPIIDAGMRELWTTGWMHNRVRMLTASFLTKNLLIPWQEGQAWFWDTLVDADLANNSQGWQWVAGCGADAAPYFRIFNPVTQGERFDPEGHYVRRWVPELAAINGKAIHAPWRLRQGILEEAGSAPDNGYPQPIVNLKTTRERALSAYQQIR